ncbi:MAG: hypothetical protein RIK87_03710 [Fuerstiella sp.]
MKTCVQLTFLLLVVSTVTGCSRFRQLTRRDYALMRDPFTSSVAAGNQTAESDEPPLPGIRPESTGVVRIGDSSAAALSDQAVADYAGTTDKNNVSGRPVVPGTAGSETDNRGIPAVTAFAGTETKSAQGRARVTAAEPVVPDLDQMAEFMEEQATASGLTETANELQQDFAEFAARRQAAWQEEVNGVRENAALPSENSIRQVGRSTDAKANMASDFATQADYSRAAENNDAGMVKLSEKATPLIRKTAVAAPAPVTAPPAEPPIGSDNPFAGAAPAPEFPAGATPAVTPPVFDKPAVAPAAAASPSADKSNPFAAFDQQRKQNAANAGAEGDRLDSGFTFDSGWRPSNAVRP